MSDTLGPNLVGRVVLGRYRIMRVLAEGGMGIIYLGRVEGSAGFAKPVVVKTVIPHLTKDASMSGMFVREARILANLQHASIVGVLDFGRVDQAYVMVLEYIHGFHLGQWMRYLSAVDRQIDVNHALYITRKVLDALHYAHESKRPDGTSLGIVHRDVSPSNVLIDLQGQVKLHDFGIARMAEDTSGYKTEVGTFKGTLPFAAPETIQGRPASPQSDLYSCAVVLYEMITGKNPFRGQLPAETMFRVLTETPPRMSTMRQGIVDSVDAAVAKAMNKTPELRYRTAAAFAEALRQAHTVSEERVATEFAEVVREDFEGELPDKLNLEPLAELDRAWRQEQEEQRSSSIPPGPFGRPSAPTLSAHPQLLRPASAGPRLGGPVKHSVPTIPSARPLILAPSASRPEIQIGLQESGAEQAPGAERRRAPRIGMGVAIGAVGIGVAVAVGASSARWIPMRQSPTQPVASVIVIERRTTAEAPPASSLVPASSAADAPDSAPSDTTPEPSPSATDGIDNTKAKTAAPGPGALAADPNALSRTFQQQQGKVQGCFARFASDIEGEPQLNVRFAVDASGTVQKADLSPSSLAGTELGRCILDIARRTKFGQQPEPRTFTIPITARRSH